MNTKNKLRKYVSPSVRNLSDLSVSGNGGGPLGVCTPGSFPWNGCSQGSAFGIPSNCGGGSNPSTGNNCQSGTNPDTGTTQCYPSGSHAGNTCDRGNYA